MYPSRLGIQLFRAQRANVKKNITCAGVTLRNVTAAPAIAVRGAGDEVLLVQPVRVVGDAVSTQRSGAQPGCEPIRAACNRLAQLSTCTYLLLRKWRETECNRVRSTQTFAARGTLLRMRISSYHTTSLLDVLCAARRRHGLRWPAPPLLAQHVSGYYSSPLNYAISGCAGMQGALTQLLDPSPSHRPLSGGCYVVDTRVTEIGLWSKEME